MKETRTMFESLDLPAAIGLFEEWGFSVLQGPEKTDITLIPKGARHGSTMVFDADLLPGIAAAILRVRMRRSPQAGSKAMSFT